ncbi:MAG: bifunctional helix-turn-helix transcriptional regulator/GNAT family N-acetyltransferase [Maricaulaceae bacterium]|jgi:DNA-binding MarR family transcriptional regulator/ribosomal protein S18 acetylase RimI-like enzyme
MRQHRDILREKAALALGSRLKRLADRLQAEAGNVFQALDLDVQPSHFPLIACLDAHGPVGVVEASQIIGVSQPAVTRAASQLRAGGLVELSADAGDSRHKIISLTPAGRDLVEHMKFALWAPVEAAATELCNQVGPDFLEQLGRLEDALSEQSLFDRVMRQTAQRDEIEIVDYAPELARAFYEINHEWVSEMYEVEAADLAQMNDPEAAIIAPGGAVVFARSRMLGVVGTGALVDMGGGVYELAKMGVLRKARGRGAGDLIIRQLIKKAGELGARELFLLTNKKSVAAIHLYEKHGFVHDAEIMERYGAEYERCNVAMKYDPAAAPEAS